jgi:hypothetical protein
MNAILLLIAVGFAEPAGPLSCPTPVVAKGDFKAGPTLTQTFELTNRGDREITFAKVEAGCGCVKRNIPRPNLRPGESTTLTLEINTLTQPDGANRWQAIVSYHIEDANRTPGELVVSVTANLSREVTVSPPQIAFSTTGEATQQLTITDSRGKPLTVVKALTSQEHLLTAVGPAAGGRQAVALKLASAAPAGQRDEVLILQTDDPAYPEFRVPVRINKKAPGQVTASPEELSVKLGAGQDEVSALVQLRAPDGKTLRIASAESDFAAVTTKFSSDPGVVGTVRITVGGLAASLPGSCKVRIKLAEPAGQEIVIPVTWATGIKK